MDKYEAYAVSYHLSDWPEDWTYQQILSELKSGDEGYIFEVWGGWDGAPSEDIATFIEDMVSSLRQVFK